MPFSRKDFLKTASLGAASLMMPGMESRHHSHSSSAPNIVFFLVDDLGYGDLSCYGNRFIETPNIDRLAENGVRFTDAYAAAPLCSPTRASILTGKYPARINLTQYLPGNEKYDWVKKMPLEPPVMPPGLPPGEKTIAEYLKDAGYITSLMGKWHLGAGKYHPRNYGFDHVVAGGPHGHHGEMFAPFDDLDITATEDGAYLTDILASRAQDFIAQNQDHPFFLFLPFFAVHRPILAKKRLIEKYKQKKAGNPAFRREIPTFAAMVEGVDQAVGQIMTTLKQKNIREETLVIFFSDNGGQENAGSDNGPLGKGKAWLYEGGIRVPLIISGANIENPGRISETPVISNDFLPTLVRSAGGQLDANYPGDGLDLTPLMRDRKSVDRDELYWHFPHYSWAGSPPVSAIRQGSFKLHEDLKSGHVELYNLNNDIGETWNIRQKYPDKVDKMTRKLHEWRKQVNAEMPTKR